MMCAVWCFQLALWRSEVPTWQCTGTALAALVRVVARGLSAEIKAETASMLHAKSCIFFPVLKESRTTKKTVLIELN
jgi:RNA-binding protein YhbY